MQLCYRQCVRIVYADLATLDMSPFHWHVGMLMFRYGKGMAWNTVQSGTPIFKMWLER